MEKPPKTDKSDANLLILKDLTYNPCNNFKFYSLQFQNVKIFIIFTYNQGKIVLILPIILGGGGGGAHVYLVSSGSCIPSVGFNLGINTSLPH